MLLSPPRVGWFTGRLSSQPTPDAGRRVGVAWLLVDSVNTTSCIDCICCRITSIYCCSSLTSAVAVTHCGCSLPDALAVISPWTMSASPATPTTDGAWCAPADVTAGAPCTPVTLSWLLRDGAVHSSDAWADAASALLSPLRPLRLRVAGVTVGASSNLAGAFRFRPRLLSIL